MVYPRPDIAPEMPPETGADREVPWNAGDALVGLILLAPASLLSAIVIYAVVFPIILLLAGKVPPYLQIISLGGASFVAAGGLAWWLGVKRRKGRFRDLGFTNLRLSWDIPLAVLGEIFIFMALALYSLVLTQLFGLRVPEQPVVKFFGRSGTGFALAVLFIVILAPIGEEVFFRGFVYSGFRRKWGVRRALVFSSAAFALFHIEPLLYAPMFMIGLALAVLFEYRRSLAPNIMLHALNNLLALLVVYSQG